MPCFFFQAEDGIRDVAVTGVQTCALPICCATPALRENACLNCAPPTAIERKGRAIASAWFRFGCQTGDFLVAETIHRVIVHQADRLHERVTDRRTDEFETTL